MASPITIEAMAEKEVTSWPDIDVRSVMLIKNMFGTELSQRSFCFEDINGLLCVGSGDAGFIFSEEKPIVISTYERDKYPFIQYLIDRRDQLIAYDYACSEMALACYTILPPKEKKLPPVKIHIAGFSFKLRNVLGGNT
ncbi:MAG: hypothetical protein IIA87_04600 [Nanoarchaeota archaeon]|nr:hypothetical protein [Nanoarchaeota archaeon]